MVDNGSEGKCGDDERACLKRVRNFLKWRSSLVYSPGFCVQLPHLAAHLPLVPEVY